ncbi:MAG: hypothetical protein K6F84_04100 [Lachnospiraceae bacterium]|nr:hypothetical protein [Lachnospiraceae bacterium]
MYVDIKELENSDYDIIENIKAAFYRLWKLKTVVILMTLVGCLLSFIYISIVGVHTNYVSAATVYSVVYGSSTDGSNGITMMNRYSDLLGTGKVCDRAAAILNNINYTSDSLRRMVSSGSIYMSGANSDSKKYGNKLTIVASSSSPNDVADIANAMAKAFTDEINDMMGTGSLQVVDQAGGFYQSKSLNMKLVVLLFTAAAFILCTGFILVKEFLNPRVYIVSQCERNKNLILGVIPTEGIKK